MSTVGLFEAKQKLSGLVQQANEGESIGITRCGKLAALIVPARPALSLSQVFADIEGIRKRAKITKKINIRSLIEEGRR